MSGYSCMPSLMAAIEYLPKNKTIMEKERIITAPEGYIIKAIDIVNGEAVITFKEKERKLPKSWEEFCEMFPVTSYEYYIDRDSSIECAFDCTDESHKRIPMIDKNILPNSPTAHAVLALCQLIQLRNAYNGDWVPDWKNRDEIKHIIQFDAEEIHCDTWIGVSASPLYFKSEELRDEFLRNFRYLIQKLKPLYGINEERYIKVEERGGKE